MKKLLVLLIGCMIFATSCKSPPPAPQWATDMITDISHQTTTDLHAANAKMQVQRNQ